MTTFQVMTNDDSLAWELLDDVPGAAPNCGSCLATMTVSGDAPFWLCAECGLVRI